MDYKNKIIEKLKSFNREGIDNLISYLINETDYFNAPASSKYHSNFKGGLVEHSWKVAELFEEKNIRYNLGLSEETVWITALMHDLCKCNFYKIGIKNVKQGKKLNAYGRQLDNWVEKEVWDIDDIFPIGHGSKSVIILQQFIKLSEIEILLIVHHMGFPDSYIDKTTYSSATKKYPEIVALHTADYESSYLLERCVE
jgi:hypothetical protein